MMDHKRKLADLKYKIVQETHRIRESLADHVSLTMLDEGMIRVLDEVSRSLDSEPNISRETIRGYAFSIFRITTDNFDFERSQIGQDLLGLSTKLADLSREI